MMQCRTTLAWVLLGWVAGGIGAQEVTLDEALAEALSRGPDHALVTANLVAAGASDAQARARASLTLSSSLSYQAAKGINDPAAPYRVATAPATTRVSSLNAPADDVVPQNVQGSLTLASPLTSVTLTGGGTFQVDAEGRLLESTSVGANLGQTLLSGYFGGTAQVAADKSALTYQTAVLNAQSGRNRALLAVKTAYFNLQAAQARALVYAQALAQRREALKFTQSKAQSGTATAYDLRVAQAAVRSAELDKTGGDNALATARLRLAHLLGRADADLRARDSEDPPAPARDADEAVALALENRVEIRTTLLSARASAIDASAAAGAAVPTVSLTAGVNYSQANSLSTKGEAQSSSVVATLGVRVTPPSLDAGLADQQRLQAQTLQGVYQTQVDQLRRSIPVDVRDAWNTWQLNLERWDLARTTVENADINRQILKSQFDAGARPVSDWLNAEVAYSNAQLGLLSARLTSQTSAASLQNLMGL